MGGYAMQQAPMQGYMGAPGQLDIRAILSGALGGAKPPMAAVPVGGAATRPYRRLYIGSAPPCTDAELMAFFSTTIANVYMPGEHVVSAQTGGPGKPFAFLELRTVDLATAVLQLDGIAFKGQSLKIRRPHDYNPLGQPPAGPVIKFNVHDLVISSTVPDGPNKFFIGGLPHAMTEDQLRELLSAFGPLRAMHLVRDPGAPNNKGYAFAEYSDPSVTDGACGALNGMMMADKALTVRRATGGANGGSALGAAPAGMPAYGAPSLPLAFDAASMGLLPSHIGRPSHAPTRPPARLLRLQGMISGEDMALPPAGWAELLEDISGGLQEHGTIARLHVPRGGPYVGNVYVMFAELPSAIAAARDVMGKTFDGRSIPVEYLAEGSVMSDTEVAQALTGAG
jgi:splicing factor U2AF subunit